MTMPPGSPQPGYQGPNQPGYQGGPPPQQPPTFEQPTVQVPRPGSFPPPSAPPAAKPRTRSGAAIWVLGVIALIGVIAGLSIKEDGRNAWDSVHAWGAVAIVGALAVLAPVAGRSFGLTGFRAWQTAACGAGALLLFWVLFTLPDVGSNTSLLTTVGVAAGLIAAWLAAPGRPAGSSAPPPTW